jgi:hypothetical protein
MMDEIEKNLYVLPHCPDKRFDLRPIGRYFTEVIKVKGGG